MSGRGSSKYKTWGKARSTRLKHFGYSSPNTAYHVIIGSHEKKPLFNGDELNAMVVDTLKKSAPLYGYGLAAYCLMPDHLHILTLAGSNQKHLSKFIRGFKSYSTRSAGRRLWQRSYYEHVVRKDEALIKVAEYIVANPVRKGMVQNPDEYPWSEIFYDQIASSQE